MGQLLNVNDIIDDPLAGCNDLFHHEGNFITFKNSLTLRLAIYTSKAIAQKLCDQIVNEYTSLAAQPLPVRDFEYVINELQYEFRRASHKSSDLIESRIIRGWVLNIAGNKTMDDALEFLTILKTNREKRIR